MNFATSLKELIPNEIFTDRDLKLAFPSHTLNAIHKGVSRSLASKELVPLKRGLYTFGEGLRKGALSEYAMANQMYGPSYISFESALSYHGLIPEAVYTITSACRLRKTKTFTTPLGNFSFDFVPCELFFMGVERIVQLPHHFLVANPVKALFDFVYLRKKEYAQYADIEQDLRIDFSDLKKITQSFSVKELESVAESYQRKRIRNFCRLIIREFK